MCIRDRLPRAARGMKNLVVCTDAFTKHVSLYAIGRPTTSAAVNIILNKDIPKNGPIKKILSDQGLSLIHILTVMIRILLFSKMWKIYGNCTKRHT